MRYFKKDVPLNPIILFSGDPLKFPTIDNRTGFFATEDRQTLDDLDQCISNHRYGITEIQQAEYDEWNKKKAALPESFRPSTWNRDEIAMPRAPDTLGARQPARSPPTATNTETGPAARPAGTKVIVEETRVG